MTIVQQFEARGREGEARGVEKGRVEEQQAIARRCLQQGLSLEIISQITGLTLEAIKALNAAITPH